MKLPFPYILWSTISGVVGRETTEATTLHTSASVSAMSHRRQGTLPAWPLQRWRANKIHQALPLRGGGTHRRSSVHRRCRIPWHHQGDPFHSQIHMDSTLFLLFHICSIFSFFHVDPIYLNNPCTSAATASLQLFSIDWQEHKVLLGLIDTGLPIHTPTWNECVSMQICVSSLQNRTSGGSSPLYRSGHRQAMFWFMQWIHTDAHADLCSHLNSLSTQKTFASHAGEDAPPQVYGLVHILCEGGLGDARN